jgi:ferrochelatase
MGALMGAARRIAVVLFNLGGPDGPKAVRPFLNNLFSDPAIIGAPAFVRIPLAAFISTTRAPSAKKNYDLMGGASPLLPETRAQSDALQTELSSRLPQDTVQTFIAMRYWKPFSSETAKAVAAFAPDEVVLLPLYPHFSTTTTGSSLKAWKEAYKGPGKVRLVCCYPEADGFVEAHAQRIRQTWEKAGSPSNTRLLFSAHGLPEKVIAAGDPYQSQIEATAAAVAARLGSGWDWQVCYQSRVGPLKWIGPSTPDALQKAAADGKGVLVTPIAFVSEHVETLVELDHEYAELARGLGISPYLRAPALGVQPEYIRVLADAVLQTSKDVQRHGPGVCQGSCVQCPNKTLN